MNTSEAFIPVNGWSRPHVKAVKYVSYQEIAAANKRIKFADIGGKKYAEVAQRVKVFRMLYPQGFIISEMLKNEDGICVIRSSAGIYDEDGNAITLGTGIAYEREGNSNINRRSYIENCETSAVGRALGFLSIGSDEHIASFDEMASVKAQQDAEKLGQEFSGRKYIVDFCNYHQIPARQFTEYYDQLCNDGIVQRKSSDNMTLEECDRLLEAVEYRFLRHD